MDKIISIRLKHVPINCFDLAETPVHNHGLNQYDLTKMCAYNHGLNHFGLTETCV